MIWGFSFNCNLLCVCVVGCVGGGVILVEACFGRMGLSFEVDVATG
jgi:hypothetical protein